MPDGTGLDRFAREFPERVYDVGIAEQHAVTFAAGLAAEGLRPVCAIYSTFLQRGFDQIVHDVALQELPVTFVLDRAGLVGADGPTHHGLLDLAYLRAIPHLVIAAPRDENELAAPDRDRHRVGSSVRDPLPARRRDRDDARSRSQAARDRSRRAAARRLRRGDRGARQDGARRAGRRRAARRTGSLGRGAGRALREATRRGAAGRRGGARARGR